MNHARKPLGDRPLDGDRGRFKIERSVLLPPSSSGLGYLVLSQGTGVRVPVGVLNQLTRFWEGEPPGKPIAQAARTEPRPPRITKGHLDRQRPYNGESYSLTMIAIEFYGVPRLRARTGLVRLEAATVGQALRELGRLYPALGDSSLAEGTLPEVFKLSLNGDRFVSDPETALKDGDTLLLLSADVGG